jgi:NAD-dependent dihydropyrimidine dehydrogenase PreA subunit
MEWKISIEMEKCTGCGERVENCPGEVYELVDAKAVIANPEECHGCRACEDVCPENAITSRRTDQLERIHISARSEGLFRWQTKRDFKGSPVFNRFGGIHGKKKPSLWGRLEREKKVVIASSDCPAGTVAVAIAMAHPVMAHSAVAHPVEVHSRTNSHSVQFRNRTLVSPMHRPMVSPVSLCRLGAQKADGQNDGNGCNYFFHVDTSCKRWFYLSVAQCKIKRCATGAIFALTRYNHNVNSQIMLLRRPAGTRPGGYLLPGRVDTWRKLSTKGIEE